MSVPREVSSPRRTQRGSLGPAAAALCVAAITLAAGAAVAEDRAVHWLMKEPVTLFDLGIFRLQRDLREAADELAERGELPPAPRAGAYYDWHRQRIVAYLTITTGARHLNEAACRETYDMTVDALLAGNPSGPRRAETYLENLFLHEGPGNVARPRNLAAELAAMVQLEVTLLPRDQLAASPAMVKCVGRLDSAPAEILTSVRG